MKKNFFLVTMFAKVFTLQERKLTEIGQSFKHLNKNDPKIPSKNAEALKIEAKKC